MKKTPIAIVVLIIIIPLGVLGYKSWIKTSSSGGYPIYNPPVDTSSGIQGKVVTGPTCPVMKNPPDPQCADRPYQTKLAVTTSDGSQVIKEFSSDANGTFSVKVPPGEYAIGPAATASSLPYCRSRDTIKVTADVYSETTVYCDTGIR